MQRFEFTANDPDSGQRADRFIATQMETLSRSRVKALIKSGAVTMDGAVLADPNARVRSGMVFTLDVPDPRPATPEPQDLPLDILFEDEDVIVLNKAAGMAVHPAPGTWDGTLVNALLHHCQGALPGIGGVERPGIVHRLDKDTTGVMIAAKTEAAVIGLSPQFADHTIDRMYIAVSRGAPRPLSGKVDAAIARSTTDRKKMAVVRNPESNQARHAVTHYRATETFGRLDKATGLPAAARLECRLETGRTHQIRVHMAHIGAPLIGDAVYGRHKGIKSDGAGPAFLTATQSARSFPRQALHAARLGFVHPVSGKSLSFEAPMPDDMAGLLAALRDMPT